MRPLPMHWSRLLNNSASNGGGVYSDNDPVLSLSVEFKNTIIAYNNASINGGGVYLQSGTMLISNCNVVYNEAVSAGTALYDGAAATVKNSIVYGTAPSIIHGSPDVTYSDVQSGFVGIGNIDVDPLFVDAALGDYHLQSSGWRWFSEAWFLKDDTDLLPPWGFDAQTSRCIDAGDPLYPLDKEAGVVSYEAWKQQKYALNQRVNMGAYGGTKEASMPPFDFALSSDFNNDGIVNLFDLSHLASKWTHEAQLSTLMTLSQEWLSVTSWHEEQ
jgi:hypothetical protein